MRLKTLLTLSVGVTAGAGAMYLFDPEHGLERRREARRGALRSARNGAVGMVRDLRGRAEEMAVAATAGYRESRAEDVRDTAAVTREVQADGAAGPAR